MKVLKAETVDTDDLSEKAYDIIVQAARMCDTLKTEFGALSLECENEGVWLERVQTRLQKIVKDPEAYVDYWGLEEEEGITASQMKQIAQNLSIYMDEIKSNAS